MDYYGRGGRERCEQQSDFFFSVGGVWGGEEEERKNDLNFDLPMADVYIDEEAFFFLL